LFVAPGMALLVWLLPLPALSPAAHQVLAVLAGAVTLWISEAIPLPVTALAAPAVCIVLGVAPAKEVFKNFADPIIFVFLGGFLIAEGMLQHGLNRRIAFTILSLPGVGRSPTRVLIAFSAVTAALSAWVSNTATTAMMFPIALAILAEMARQKSAAEQREISIKDLSFGTALMLAASFASSVGGLATPIGTPPNLIGLGLIEKNLDVRITFFQWMAFAAPLALVLVAFVCVVLRPHGTERNGFLGGQDWLVQEKQRLGPWTRGQANVLIAFIVTVLLWITPGVVALVLGNNAPAARWWTLHFPESVVAVMGAVLLFVLPTRWRGGAEFTLTWRAARNIDWGTILLFGGGLALGDLMFSTGLAKWMGEGIAHALSAHSVFALVVLFAAVGALVSETTSNAASATMVVPVAIAVAQGAGVNPLQPALAACLGSSMGFMLPVSTPPNAIVYGSGCVPLLKMMRHGIALDLFGIAAVTVIVQWLVPLILKL
jgi:solute carrier family 13 (sodium-dependent dicarboxylate transporter), member 2/3/5